MENYDRSQLSGVNMPRILAIALCMVLCGCTTNIGQPPPDATPVDVPLAKLAQPAFAGDYAGRNVHFQAMYAGIVATVLDLPIEYRDGFVRITLLDSGVYSGDIVIPKDRADAVLALKSGQKIDVVAYAQLETQTALQGNQAQRLLFVVSSFRPISPPATAKAKAKTKPRPKAPSQH
jgi:hypothetical protein